MYDFAEFTAPTDFLPQQVLLSKFVDLLLPELLWNIHAGLVDEKLQVAEFRCARFILRFVVHYDPFRLHQLPAVQLPTAELNHRILFIGSVRCLTYLEDIKFSPLHYCQLEESNGRMDLLGHVPIRKVRIALEVISSLHCLTRSRVFDLRPLSACRWVVKACAEILHM